MDRVPQIKRFRCDGRVEPSGEQEDKPDVLPRLLVVRCGVVEVIDVAISGFK